MISKLFKLFDNQNIVLYNVFFMYMDNDSLFELYQTNKELSTFKSFIKNIIISRCASKIDILNNYECSMNQYYEFTLHTRSYEYEKKIILSYSQYHNDTNMIVLLKNNKLLYQFNKLRKGKWDDERYNPYKSFV
jgi:hypothetical protein